MLTVTDADAESLQLAGSDEAPATTEEVRPRRRRRWLAPAAAVGGPTLLIAAHAARYGSWLIDDAGITFAYARSLAHGDGFVQQAGAETIEGYSNPLWLLLHVIGHKLGLFDRGAVFGVPDYVAFPKALGLLCCVGILAATYAAAATVIRQAWLATMVVGVGLAAIPSFVVWTVSGLENPLYGLAAAMLAAVLVRASVNGWLLTPQAAAAASAIALMAALTRPDGIVLVGAYPLLVLLRVRRETLGVTARSIGIAVAAFGGPFGAFLIWRYAVFGRWVPNTAVAKSQGVPGLIDFELIGELLSYPGPLVVVVGAVLVGFTAGQPSSIRDALLACGVPLLLTLLAYGALEPDWMGEHRFATPIWVLGTMLVGLAAVHVAVEATLRTRVGLAGLTAVTLLLSSVVLREHQRDFRQSPAAPLCLVTDRYGRMFNTVGDLLGIEEGSLLLPDLGGTLLTSRFEIVDLAGLTDPTIADAYHDGDIQVVRDHIFEDVRPTFIHTHGSWAAMGTTDDPRLTRDYVQITDVDWVRRDAVPDGDATDEVVAVDKGRIQDIDPTYLAAPRQRCGDVLRPGQTLDDSPGMQWVR